jgi:hypothetical protein
MTIRQASIKSPHSSLQDEVRHLNQPGRNAAPLRGCQHLIRDERTQIEVVPLDGGFPGAGGSRRASSLGALIRSFEAQPSVPRVAPTTDNGGVATVSGMTSLSWKRLENPMRQGP